MTAIATPQSMAITGPIRDRYNEILTPETLTFLCDLHRSFNAARLVGLERRHARQAEITRGEKVGFLDETADIRQEAWKVSAPAPELLDRRCEITGPTDRRMTINALNSGARIWMADFEDANTPTWDNLVSGQINLADAIDGTIAYLSPEGREYALADQVATIVVRPRGWHLDEKHVTVDDEPISGALFDFGCYVTTCVAEHRKRGQRPFFYLPKTESHLEARLWNEIFTFTEHRFDLEPGTIRATVLIETILAAFEMDEILYELRDHAAGLNAGRWDYLFSLIKKFADLGDEFVLPDRNSVTMTAPFMQAYSELLVKTCHHRGAHAIGGMAAFIPSRRDPEVNAVALEKVREDKTREATIGFDGSWVAHPDLVPICTEVFDSVLGDRPNQIDRQRDDLSILADDLVDLALPGSTVTLAGLRNNVAVSLRYLAAWLRGQGAVAIFNLMEDAATAEIARSQIWQWLRHKIVLDDGRTITEDLVRSLIAEEIDQARSDYGESFDEEAFSQAASLVSDLVFAKGFAEFLTLSAYDRIT